MLLREEYQPTKDQLELNVLAKWISAASENTGLVFTNPFHPERALLIDAGRDDIDLTNKFSTLVQPERCRSLFQSVYDLNDSHGINCER